MLLRFPSFRAAARARVLLPALVTITGATAAAPAASALELGLQDDGVFLNQRIGQRTQAFDVAKTIGATHIRSIIYWDTIAGGQARQTTVPRRYRYDFRALDSLAAAADARGIKLQLVLTGRSPAYATADHRVGNFKPNPKLYAAWVKTVVSRYRGRGYRYSLWNEPNFVGWLKPLKAAPQLYRGIVSAGYRAAKQADLSAEILVAELASFSTPARSIAPLDFLRAMRCLVCTTLPADGFAYHPYDLTHEPARCPD